MAHFTHILCKFGGFSFKNDNFISFLVLSQVLKHQFFNKIFALALNQGTYDLAGFALNFSLDSEKNEINMYMLAQIWFLICPANVTKISVSDKVDIWLETK